MRLRSSIPTILVLLAFLAPQCAQARKMGSSGPEDFRIGISFGGISFIGFIMEYRWDHQAVDFTVGTWAFRDISLSVVGKQYFGPGNFRPFAGVGLWAVIAPHHGRGEREGIALLARAPIGFDWNLGADHHLGSSISLNRALWIQRKDPVDDTPPSDRLIPLPGFYYRWKR